MLESESSWAADGTPFVVRVIISLGGGGLASGAFFAGGKVVRRWRADLKLNFGRGAKALRAD